MTWKGHRTWYRLTWINAKQAWLFSKMVMLSRALRLYILHYLIHSLLVEFQRTMPEILTSFLCWIADNQYFPWGGSGGWNYLSKFILLNKLLPYVWALDSLPLLTLFKVKLTVAQSGSPCSPSSAKALWITLNFLTADSFHKRFKRCSRKHLSCHILLPCSCFVAILFKNHYLRWKQIHPEPLAI